MKKRLVTTLFSFICAASLALSFTACDSDNNENDGSDQQPTIGVEVTEEQWNLAFERALNATNITYGATESHINVMNTYESVWNVYLNAGAEIEAYQTIQSETNVGPDCFVIKDSVVYVIRHHQIVDYAYEYENELNIADFIQQHHFTQSADNTLFKIDDTGHCWDYYSEFEFVEGEYCANLFYFIAYEHEYGNYLSIPTEIKVKIDSDGYLRYWYWSYEIEETLSGQTSTYTYVLTFDNYGTTVIDVPQEVLDAVEEYKSNNN